MSKKQGKKELDLVDFTAVEETPPFRSRYDGRQAEVTLSKASVPSGEQITKQAMADDCDINKIIDKYKRTGVLPNAGRQALAQFGDFSRVPGYQESLNMVMEAQDMFMQLPAALRNRFRNDPGELIHFLSDTANRDEAVKLGLIDPSTGRPPLPVEPQAATGGTLKGEPATPSANASGGK